MTLAKIQHGEIVPMYRDTGSSLGFYRILPGYPSYIVLNEKLLEGSESVHKFIYQALVDYHNSIPHDSRARVFAGIHYVEDILPPEAIPQPVTGPQLVLVGRAVRRWRFSYLGEGARVVGKAG